MKLLLLRDKKPGHFRQVEGLALVVARMTSVEVTRLEVRPRALAQNELRERFSTFFAANPARWLRLLYRIDPSSLERPDAIIGSGRPTISAGIMLSRLFGAPFIYSGRIDGYDTSDVALQLVNSPRFAYEPRSVLTQIPSMIDPDQLPRRRMLNTLADLNGAHASLLVGGNAHTHRYAATDWTALVDFVRQSAETLGLRWQVSTSRRSPASLRPAFEQLERAGTIDAFIDFRAAGAGSADVLYGADVLGGDGGFRQHGQREHRRTAAGHRVAPGENGEERGHHRFRRARRTRRAADRQRHPGLIFQCIAQRPRVRRRSP